MYNYNFNVLFALLKEGFKTAFGFKATGSEFALYVNRAETSKQVKIRLNLEAGEAQIKTFEGTQNLVVPVIMLRDTVVNGSRVTVEELLPMTWNGVPVTVDHPTINGENVSANSPEVLEEFAIGRIFNSTLDGDKLKAEAWLDIAKTNKVDPDLIKTLQSGTNMDVSTGYFARDLNANGTFEGEEFNNQHVDIRPDHLALLPNSEGACSWEKGCGVRANKTDDPEKPETNKTDLIVNMVETVLSKIFTAKASKDFDQKEMVSEIVNEVSAALKEVNTLTEKTKQNEDCKCESLSAADKAALEFARNQYNGFKESLITKITGSLDVNKEDLEKMEVAQLEVIANGIKPPAAGNFNGRPLPVSKTTKDENDDYSSMLFNGVDALKSKKKEVA